MAQPQTFTDVTPIQQSAAPPQTFSNVTPISSQPSLLSRAWKWATTPGPLQQGAGKPTGEMPGSFEGHPENIGEWVPASFGEMAGGARDVVRGDVSKGLHRVISGVGNAMLPALPFAAAGAPVATGIAAATGTAGQAGGRGVAKSLGATDDQADLAGDVTGIASGFGSTKLPAGKIAASMKALAGPAADAASELPVLKSVVSAGKALGKYKGVPGELADIWKGNQADALGNLPSTGARPAAATGEALASVPQRGSISSAMQPPAAGTPIQRGSLSQMLQEQLNKSLDATPQNPKAPIYQRQVGTAEAAAKDTDYSAQAVKEIAQGRPYSELSLDERSQVMQRAQQLKQEAADMPQGHTAVKSSALRSYKYDPAAKEFHARATSGDTTYVYGDVSPEDASAFEKASSKGQAWQQIRRNPLVAKIVNGKRVNVTPARGSISQGMQTQ